MREVRAFARVRNIRQRAAEQKNQDPSWQLVKPEQKFRKYFVDSKFFLALSPPSHFLPPPSPSCLFLYDIVPGSLLVLYLFITQRTMKLAIRLFVKSRLQLLQTVAIAQR